MSTLELKLNKLSFLIKFVHINVLCFRFQKSCRSTYMCLSDLFSSLSFSRRNIFQKIIFTHWWCWLTCIFALQRNLQGKIICWLGQFTDQFKANRRFSHSNLLLKSCKNNFYLCIIFTFWQDVEMRWGIQHFYAISESIHPFKFSIVSSDASEWWSYPNRLEKCIHAK